jgi:hypothetical protein
MTSAAITLERAAITLMRRLARLHEQLREDQPALWLEYAQLAAALASVSAQLTPEASGRLLTTAELSRRLGIAPKTLLRRKARGEIQPAAHLGRRGRAALRWAPLT